MHILEEVEVDFDDDQARVTTQQIFFEPTDKCPLPKAEFADIR